MSIFAAMIVAAVIVLIVYGGIGTMLSYLTPLTRGEQMLFAVMLFLGVLACIGCVGLANNEVVIQVDVVSVKNEANPAMFIVSTKHRTFVILKEDVDADQKGSFSPKAGEILVIKVNGFTGSRKYSVVKGKTK